MGGGAVGQEVCLREEEEGHSLMGGFCDGSGEGIGRGGPFNFFVTRILHFEIHVFVFFSPRKSEKPKKSSSSLLF